MVSGSRTLDNGEYRIATTCMIDINSNVSELLTVCTYQADPETICQYSGKTDKNGKKVFENDILKGFQYPFLSDGNHNYFASVEWFEDVSAFGTYTFKNPQSKVRGISEGSTSYLEDWDNDDWEVIGNIFDNPELVGD